MRHFIPAAALAAALALAAPLATPAFAADPGVKIGLLTCKSTGESGGIITTETRFACVYDGAGGEVTEHYTGEISKIGLDLTTEQDVTLVWARSASRASSCIRDCRARRLLRRAYSFSAIADSVSNLVRNAVCTAPVGRGASRTPAAPANRGRPKIRAASVSVKPASCVASK
jgi:hypothetical protein